MPEIWYNTEMKVRCKMKTVCKWKRYEDEDYWETDCDNAFCTIEGSLRDNNFKFCPYCGKEIKEVKK